MRDTKISTEVLPPNTDFSISDFAIDSGPKIDSEKMKCNFITNIGVAKNLLFCPMGYSEK